MPKSNKNENSLSFDLTDLAPLDPSGVLPEQDFSYPEPRVMTLISESFSIDLSDPGRVQAAASRLKEQPEE